MLSLPPRAATRCLSFLTRGGRHICSRGPMLPLLDLLVRRVYIWGIIGTGEKVQRRTWQSIAGFSCSVSALVLCIVCC
jgi:hypothetical protein